MDMTGSHTINATPERVFEALNDQEVLRLCVPGCKSLEQIEENEMAATVVVKVGAMPAKFNCKVKIIDLIIPKSYKITGEGKAGSAGGANGSAKVKLSPDPAGTLLEYEVETELEGMLSKFGSSLLDGIAKDLSGQFFENLSNHISRTEEIDAPAAEPAPAPVAKIKLPARVWIATACVVGLPLLYVLFGKG